MSQQVYRSINFKTVFNLSVVKQLSQIYLSNIRI